jgi:hypothetical protein
VGREGGGKAFPLKTGVSVGFPVNDLLRQSHKTFSLRHLQSHEIG